jgi:hypothetical protein
MIIGALRRTGSRSGTMVVAMVKSRLNDHRIATVPGAAIPADGFNHGGAVNSHIGLNITPTISGDASAHRERGGETKRA